MAFWTKKKPEVTPTPEAEPIKPPCFHTWIDFPWFIRHKWTPNTYGDKGTSILSVYEPYVCVHCKERKDVLLYQETEEGISTKRHWDKLREWEEKYKDHAKPRPVVEDMINDAIYVDKGKVAIVAKMRGYEDEAERDKYKYVSRVVPHIP